jgi:hypothetical protein
MRAIRQQPVRLSLLIVLLAILAACQPEGDTRLDGPLLIQEITLAPGDIAPTRVLSATPSPQPQTPTPVSLNRDTATPTQLVGENIVVLTSTLPPSKTPTATPTLTRTLPPLPPPTLPPPTLALLPTTAGSAQGVVPIPTAMGVVVCSTTWFFAGAPTTCPLNMPLVSMGAFLPYQNGFMLWVGQQDAIYALYNDNTPPRWQVFNDAYVEGMPDTDPALGVPPSGTWQPRRGFGLLWRNQPTARSRLGWALTEAETAYTVQVQISSDGTIYVSEPAGGVYALSADGNYWSYFGR